MGWREKFFYYGGFAMSFIGFLVSFGISIWTLRSGDYLSSGLALILGVILMFWSAKLLEEATRILNGIIKIQLLFDEETIVELQKIKKYYEFGTVEEVICDSLDLSIMALEEQTKNDRILCFYDKKNEEIIAIDSMSSDGEIWEAIDGKNERDEESKDDEDITPQ